MNIKHLLAIPSKIPTNALNDPDLPVELTSLVKSTGEDAPPPDTINVHGEQDQPEEDPGKLKLNAKGGFRILVLNSPDDLNELQATEKAVLDKWPEVNQVFEQGKSLLAYVLEGEAQAGLPGLKLGSAKLGFDASASLNLTSFRIHNGSELLPMALMADATSMTSIFQKSQVVNLQPNEAVSFGSRLSINFSSELNVADAFAGSVKVVSKSLNLDGKLNLQSDASLTLSAGFQIEDDFDIIIQRLPANSDGDSLFRVSVAKKKQSSTQMALSASVSAGIVKDENFHKLVDQFFLGIDRNVFEPILAKIESLDDSLKPYIDKAASLLGQPEGFDTPAAFKAFYEKKRAELEETVTKKLNLKVSAGISFEYAKVSSQEAIYAAEMSADFLETHYEAVRGFKLDTLLNIQQPTRDYRITEFLKRDISEVKKSFGISLSLGNFKLGATKTRITKSVKEAKLIDEQVSYRVASHSDSISKTFVHGKNKDRFYMHFEGHMDDYVSTEAEQTADKFDYGFGLSVESTENRTDDEELKNYVDWALTWDIIGQAEFESTITKVQEVVEAADGPVQYSLSLGVGGKQETEDENKQFGSLIKAIGQTTEIAITSALGAAVPYAEYNKKPVLLRATMDFRRLNYGNFWVAHFNERSSNKGRNYSSKIAKALAKSIKAVDEASAEFERGPFGPGAIDFEPARMERILDLNPAVQRDVNRFKDCFGQLTQDISGAAAYEESLEDFFDKLKKMNYDKEFNLRFVGRLLLDLSKEAGMDDIVSRSLKLSYSQGGTEKVMVFG